MKTTISLTVRDVFNYISDSEKSSQIFDQTEKNFIEKYPMFGYIGEECYIGSIDVLEDDLYLDYFDLIIWNDLTFEQKLDFFREYPLEDIMNDAGLEFKEMYVRCLEEDLDIYIKELNNKIEIFLPQN